MAFIKNIEHEEIVRLADEISANTGQVVSKTLEHDAEQTNPAPSISAKVIVRLSPEYLKAMVIR